MLDSGSGSEGSEPGTGRLAELRPVGGPDQRLVDGARRRLLDMISTGALRPGDKLGTERDLAAELSVSRSTLRQVLAVLAQAGVVRRVPGRSGGTFVAHSKVERDLSVIVGLPEYLRRQGFVAGTQVLSATMAGADDLTAMNLDVPAGSLVVDIARIRLADGLPISLERVRLPAEIFPGLLDQPLGGSIYDLLESRYDMVPVDVVEHLEVVEASADEAALLGIAAGAPLLAITRTSRTADGMAFEFSNDLFRADRTCVTFRTKSARAEIVGKAASEPLTDLRAVSG